MDSRIEEEENVFEGSQQPAKNLITLIHTYYLIDFLASPSLLIIIKKNGRTNEYLGLNFNFETFVLLFFFFIN